MKNVGLSKKIIFECPWSHWSHCKIMLEIGTVLLSLSFWVRCRFPSSPPSPPNPLSPSPQAFSSNVCGGRGGCASFHGGWSSSWVWLFWRWLVVVVDARVFTVVGRRSACSYFDGGWLCGECTCFQSGWSWWWMRLFWRWFVVVWRNYLGEFWFL